MARWLYDICTSYKLTKPLSIVGFARDKTFGDFDDLDQWFPTQATDQVRELSTVHRRITALIPLYVA